MRERVVLFLMLLLCAFSAQAEIVIGRVVDAKSKEPLEGANIDISAEIDMGDGHKASMRTGTTTDSLGVFYFRGIALRTEMKISYIGYYEKTRRVSCDLENTDTLRIGDIELEPSELLLKTLTVTGHAKRFTMRGDTLVFHPEAFHLNEGDRLENLIEKLPGVVNDNGKLTWNGKPVRFNMNGNEGFNQAMLSQLPAEAVKEIKGFDKKSELEERTGLDDGSEDQVLDITIKKGFLDKWYGSVDMSGSTKGTYRGKLDSNFLSESNPMMAMVQVADDDKSFEPQGFNGMIGTGGSYFRQQMGALGYQHNWKPTFEGWRNMNRWSISSNLNHNDERMHRFTTTETFMNEINPTLQKRADNSYDHSIKIPLTFESFINLGANDRLNLSVDASVKKSDIHEVTEQTTSLNLPEYSSALGLVNQSTRNSLQHEEAKGIVAQAIYSHLWGKNEFNLMSKLKWLDNRGDSQDQGNYHYYQTTGGESTVTDLQQVNSKTGSSEIYLKASMKNWLSEKIQLTTAYQFDLNHGTDQQDRMRNGEIDRTNTLNQASDRTEHKFILSTVYKKGKVTIQPDLYLTLQYEKIDYHRGKLDTLATRNQVRPDAALNINWRPNSKHTLSISGGYDESVPEIIQTLAMTDDTNPLFIIEGNPLLHRSKKIDGTVNYRLREPKHEQLFSFIFDYTKDIDPIQSVSYYNPQTGAYRTHMENTKGGQNFRLRLSYDRSLNDNLTWMNNVTANSGTSYGVLTILEDDGIRTLTQQNRTTLTYAPSLEYSKKELLINFKPSGTWQHYKYQGDDVEGFNLYNYNIATTIQYTLGKWRFVLNPEFKSRSGFNNPDFNRTYLVLNGNMNYEVSKHVNLKLTVNDLLNKDQSYYNSETSTSRTETIRDRLHNYVMLQMVYRFDAKGQKK